MPELPKPKGSYVPAARAGSLIFTAGMLPLESGEIKIKGIVGKDIDIEDGQKAARIAVLNALSAIKQEIGTLNKIKRILRVNGSIRSEKGFADQAKVLNGASDLLLEIFGEAGKHTRTAAGVPELPLNSPVEIDMIAEVES